MTVWGMDLRVREDDQVAVIPAKPALDLIGGAGIHPLILPFSLAPSRAF